MQLISSPDFINNIIQVGQQMDYDPDEETMYENVMGDSTHNLNDEQKWKLMILLAWV
jgi:hypothetical protein